MFTDGGQLVAAALEGFGILYILEDLVAAPIAGGLSSACWSRGASRSQVTASITPSARHDGIRLFKKTLRACRHK